MAGPLIRLGDKTSHGGTVIEASQRSDIDGATSAGPMPAWGRTALLAGLFFFGCWCCAILYWHMTDRMPTVGELAFCLVGAPLLVTGGVWLSRRMLEQAAPPSPAAEPVAAGAANERGLAILDGALRLPCGSSAEEVHAAIRSNKACPDLDRELLDHDGFPVMTARCLLADDESLREEITEWMAASGFTGAQFIDEHWRALVLATQVVDDLARGLGSAADSIRLRTIGPDNWSTVRRRAAQAWLVHKASQYGVPADRITSAHELPSKAGPASIESHLAQAGDVAGLTMLVAFASNVGNETVSRWSESGTLFTSATASGQIPGEGAAGLLFASSRHKLRDAASGYLTLAPIESETQEMPDEKARRGESNRLAVLAARACDTACIDAARLTAIAGDTGHLPKRVRELMGLASGLSPELDAQDDVIRVGTAAATCGRVPALAAIMLAAHLASVRQAPVLWASNESTSWRAVAVVCPPMPNPLSNS